MKLLENYYFQDEFCPHDREKYLQLSDFNVQESDVIWVDKDSPKLEEYLEAIKNSARIGVDTESLVG